MAYKDKEKERAYHRAYYNLNREKINKYQKAWRKKNPEKAKASQKTHYDANSEKMKAKHQAYYKAHKKECRAYNKVYHKANAEKIKTLKRIYRKANREKTNEYYRYNSHKRKALKLKVPHQVINEKEVYLRDGWICQHCKERVDKRFKYPYPKSASLDHIIPLTEGGSHTYVNVQLTHLKCNLSKQARILPQGEQMRLF